MTSLWVPVVAAVGASGLTGLSGFGAIAWQQRRIERAAKSATQAEAYRVLIEHSLSFTVLAHALRQTAELRSGLGEDLDVALGIRRPLDPLELYDRLAKGFEPINTAWAKIKVSGSPETGQLADQLVQACADLLDVAGEIGTARGKLQTRLRGPAWSADQRNALQAAIELVMATRTSLIGHARTGFGDQAAWITRMRDVVIPRRAA
jgi:hypothetical protein